MNGRIVLAALVLVGGAGIAIAGASPQSTLTPTKAHQAPPGDASVKGTVAEVDRSSGTFVLTDGERDLQVTYVGQLPAAVELNRSLVAEGTIVHDDGQVVFEAHEIQLGCPSKYEA